MIFTRRELMHVVIAGTGMLSLPMAQRSAGEEHDGLILCLNDDCCLARESAAGYRLALHGFDGTRTFIVPAISTLSWRTAAVLRRKAEAGHNVILESAFTFADDDSAARQCRIVRDVFGLSVELNRQRAEQATSYLQYQWPVEALVRSFGEPIYIRRGDHHAIAHHLGKRIVSARRSLGGGQITFLGSPLGPLLFAGDREATLLIRHIIAERA